MLQVLCGLPHSPVMRYSPASPGDGPRGCLDGDGLYLTEDELLASLAKSPGFASDPASASCLSLSMVLTSLWLFSCSVISNSVAPRTAARQASLSFTMSQSLLKLMSIESAMLSNHLILCHPLLLLPSILPSIRVFSSESVLRIRWSKYCSFSISHEYSGLISFRIDWFESLLQHRSSKASILQHSTFFMVQLSQPYMTTGNSIALTIWTFVGKVASLFFNMLSRFVIACLPKSRHS